MSRPEIRLTLYLLGIVGHIKRAPFVIFIVNLTMFCFEEKLVQGRLKKMKMGDAGNRVPVVFPDACYMPTLPGAAMRTMRTVVQFLSSVSCVTHLTLSCGTIHIPAALSLPPYQRGDRDFNTNLNP